jgi:hypothetical protein
MRTTIRALRSLPRAVRLSRQSSPVSTFSSLPRKSQSHILRDLVRWRLRSGSLNDDFFLLGLDRVGREVDEFVSVNEFRRARDRSNRIAGRDDTSYACLLIDKLVFSRYARALGHPIPTTLGVVTADHIEWLPERSKQPLESLWDPDRNLDAFCKPIRGSKGADVFPLTSGNGSVSVDEVSVTPEALAARMRGGFVLEERIVQHEKLAALHPQSLNTLRVVTIITSRGPTVLVAALKIGTGGQKVDNYDKGGLLAEVDSASGRLTGRAFSKKLPSPLARHPDTDAPLSDFQIPLFNEAIAAACRLHDDVAAMHSVGWDVAITPFGPVILEGNPRWGAGALILCQPALVSEYVRSAFSFANGAAEGR